MKCGVDSALDAGGDFGTLAVAHTQELYGRVHKVPELADTGAVP